MRSKIFSFIFSGLVCILFQQTPKPISTQIAVICWVNVSLAVLFAHSWQMTLAQCQFCSSTLVEHNCKRFGLTPLAQQVLHLTKSWGPFFDQQYVMSTLGRHDFRYISHLQFLQIFDVPCFIVECYLLCQSLPSYSRPVGRNFQRGVRSIRQGIWGPLKAPRSPWVIGAKSCNLAISRHFIQTFGKPCFPLLIFKDFHQILHQLGPW